jgi:leucyl aminopeptidase
MRIEYSNQSPVTAIADWLVLPVADGDFSPEVQQVDAALGNALQRMKTRGDLTGKFCEALELRDVPGLAATRLLLLGTGSPDKLTAARLDQWGMTCARRLSTQADVRLAVVVPQGWPLEAQAVGRVLATAAVVGSTGQAWYKSERDRFPFQSVNVLGPAEQAAGLSEGLQTGQILGESINATRELVNRHPHDLTPQTFVERTVSLAGERGIQTEVFDEQRLRNERMGALLAVARGSQLPPAVVLYRYQGAGPEVPWVSLVGKGVTFDSGGLSLKPSDSMKSMKADMAGAATVVGALLAIARLQLPVNVLGAVGLVENMVSGNSYKLGEILTARNGTTIEVHNTDAEGRLVLADVLSYVVDQGVSRVIDLATLTGSCVVALGEEVAGAFANDQALCDELLRAARTVGEDLWQLPMFDSFADQLKCDVADIKNVGTRWGGAITAAKFLERFVGKTPWVHLDIAGPAFAESSRPSREAGGTGFGVRTLVEWLRQLQLTAHT